MDRFVFYFDVECWNGVEVYTEGGFLVAKDYTDAMSQIEGYYGADLGAVRRLESYDGSIMAFSTERAKDIWASLI